MKKLFVTLAVCLLGFTTLLAQENPLNGAKTEQNCSSIMYKEGYRGDVELSWGAFRLFEISSSHGYSVGNGLYLGLGAGFAAEFEDGFDQMPAYMAPVFVEMKQNLVCCNVSPFWGLRLGTIADISNKGVRFFANPYVGLDLSRFSIKAGYDFHMGLFGKDGEMVKHYLKVSLGVSF